MHPERREAQGLGLDIILTDSGLCCMSFLTSPGLRSSPPTRETTACKAKCLLTSQSARLEWLALSCSGSLTWSPDCTPTSPQLSGETGTSLFCALHTSSSQAPPLMSKLEQINEGLKKGVVAGHCHRGHSAWVTVRLVSPYNGACLQSGAAATVVVSQ